MFPDVNCVRILAILTCLLFPCISAAVFNSSNIIPKAYLVEFVDTSISSRSFFSDLSARQIPATQRLELSYSLFNGASFTLNDDTNEQAALQTLLSLPSVKSIHPLRTFTLPYTINAVVDSFSPSGSVASPRISEPVADTFSTHVMTGVDKLREEGYTGKGIKVGIVDTGVDYLHPALGGCFGPGCKVGFGYDLVGDNYTGSNTPVPGGLPTDCIGHGTHVAGIVAAGSNVLNFTGVAPDATIGIYRVYGCSDSTTEDIVIQAFMIAYEDGADIITCSIGSTGGWSEEPWGVVVSRIVAAGVPCTIAAGNDGSSGAFFPDTGADGLGATSVASVDNTVIPDILAPASWTTDNSTWNSFGWEPWYPTEIPNGTYPLYSLSNNSAAGCDGVDAADLSEYVVLLPFSYEPCGWLFRLEILAQHNARYVLFYNDVSDSIPPHNASGWIQSVGMVPHDLGVQWISLLGAGSQVYINAVTPSIWDLMADSSPNNVTGGYLSIYTSWGPTYEADVYPLIAAPGGNILSTYPLSQGGYAVLSGTSMATPFVAGSIALILQARGKLDPNKINSLLAANANVKRFNDGASTYPYLAPVAQQGAGLLNVYNAVHAPSVISVPSISFNDTEHFPKSTSFSIKNTGNKSITYTISYVASATFYALSSGGPTVPTLFIPPYYTPEMVNASATLAFNPSTLTVHGGESLPVNIAATLPVDVDKSRIPVYSGYIILKGSNGDSFSLPYQGIASSLRDAVIFDTYDNQTYVSQANDTEPLPEGFEFVLPPPNSTAAVEANFDVPVIYSAFSFGTSLLRVDLVPVNSTGTTNTTEVLGEKIVGSLAPFPINYQPRYEEYSWFEYWYGALTSGSYDYAPPGEYYALFRALKTFGNPDAPEDYETVQSVSFSISYSSS